MSKTLHSNDPQGVTNFIEKLEPEFGVLVTAIRNAILGSGKGIGEHIKWNSPSFFYSGDMKPFDPKTYKRDIVVVNVRKNEALLVFPTGNIIEDPNGLLEGDYSDGRRIIKFKSMDAFRARENDLKAVVRNWLDKVE